MNNTVLITGSTGGLGCVITKNLLARKYSVKGVSSNNSKKIVDFTNLAAQNNVSYDHMFCNLSTSSLPETSYENVNHVILCHGKNFIFDISTLQLQTLEESMRINFYSSFIITQQLVNTWLKADPTIDRSVSYISSVATKGGAPSEVAYHAAKRAMESAMLSFTRQYSAHNIRFNVISPGIINTPMGMEVVNKRPDILERIPLKRMTSAEQIANLVVLLLESNTITGQNFHVNGGRFTTI